MITRAGLYKKLSALDEKDSRSDVLGVLKSTIEQQEDLICQNFKQGKIGGIATAKKLAGLYDAILSALFDYACTLYPSEKDTLSFCAVGGYGRGELAPYSDLDILFLHEGKQVKRDKEITEYILYMLWDLNLKLGNASRTPAQSIALGRKDETVLTSMLDLRLLAGAEEPAENLNALLAKERTRSNKQKFIAAKLAARDRRHTAEGNSRYVIEPNIKEGKGGLRDLHVLYWIARFVYGGTQKGAPQKPHGVRAYVGLGLFDKKTAKRFAQAVEFLWQVRIHLHNLSGRATEVLSFDKQAELAKRMGYNQKYPEDRIEDFMRTYFNTAREVGALTRIACAKLESQSKLLLPQGLFRFLPASHRGIKQKGLRLDRGRLNFTSAKSIKNNPVLMLKLFRTAGLRNLDIHPDAFMALQVYKKHIDENFQQSKEAAKVFFDILLKSKAPAATLRSMNEAGILGDYLPEFGSIVGRTQFNMHHAFTVDDHSLFLVENLHDIEMGKLKREHPLSSAFIKHWDTRMRRMVYLACIFHDTGKGKGDQCIEGAALTITACRRLGLPETEIETISWLVRNHLEMSETAQRRDISDPATIEKFALIVGSITRLQMLCALTVVDIRAVGPGIWNDWKGELLRQLYGGTALQLMGVASEGGENENMTKALANDLKSISDDARKQPHYVTTKRRRKKDITELWVLTQDRENLFSDLCEAISGCGASIIGAALSTAKDGRVFNKFYLQNTEGFAFGRKNKGRLKALEDLVLKAAKSEDREISIPHPPRSRRADAIPIHARVAILPNSAGAAIIEVEGRDRPGLLLALAKTLAAHKLSVTSAHIDGAGPKAVDVFYVRHNPDINLKDTNLSDALMQVLKTKIQAKS